MSLKTLGEFQLKKYKISRTLAKNYKSRQNTAAVFSVQLDLFF